MDKKILILLVRVALGALGGYLLMRLFFPKGGLAVAALLAALVVLAAYASEWWRMRSK